MEAQFVRNIEIRDNENQTCFSFDASKQGILKAAVIYDSVREKYKNQPNIKNLRKLIQLTKSLNLAIIKNRINYLVYDSEDIANFYNYIRNFSDDIERKMLDYSSSSYNILEDILDDLEDYSYVSSFVLVDSDNPKDFDYYKLQFFTLKPKDGKDYYEKVEEQMTYDDGYNLDADVDDITGSDDEDDESEDKWTDKYIFTEEFSYPIHEAMISKIKEDIALTHDKTEKLKYFIFWRDYKTYLLRDKISDKCKEEINDLDQFIESKERIIKKKMINYNDLYKQYKKYTDVILTNEETKFNNIDTFIADLLMKFLVRNDIYFFIDLKEMFKKYDRNDKESCMYLVKELSDILVAYKYTIELKCLKHLVSEENIIGFVDTLYNYYDMYANEEAYKGLFGKNFTIDLTDNDRSKD